MFKYIYRIMPELNSQQQFDNIVNKYLENAHDVFKKIYKHLSNNQNLPLEGPVRHNTFKRLI